jgi:hypothetical protein
VTEARKQYSPQQPGDLQRFTARRGVVQAMAMGAASFALHGCSSGDEETPDPPPAGDAGTLALSATTYSIAQSAGSVTVTVNRVGGSFGAASIMYATSNGTATAGSQYTATSGTLNWAAGDGAAKTFTIPVSNAAPFIGDRSFTVTLSAPTGAVAGTAIATITIAGSGNAGTLALSAAASSVAQAAGTLTITVSRSAGSTGAASVAYATANGTASAGADYTAASGTLNWAAGDAAARTFSVSISNAVPFNGSRTFTVALSGASGAALGTPATATVTINGSGVVAVNHPPVWTTVPDLTFTQGVAQTLSIATYVSDADGDALAIAMNGITLPAGVTFDAANKLFRYDGNGAAGTAPGVVLTANDGKA